VIDRKKTEIHCRTESTNDTSEVGRTCPFSKRDSIDAVVVTFRVHGLVCSEVLTYPEITVGLLTPKYKKGIAAWRVLPCNTHACEALRKK